MRESVSQAIPAIARPVVAAFIKRVHKIVFPLEHLYLHGSIAMGGFHPEHSDLDFLIVTSRPLSPEEKLALTRLCLVTSNEPYPIELSVLTVRDLTAWRHPSPFDFHYSEGWRTRFESALRNRGVAMLQSGMTDPDLAAHVRVTCERGLVLYGEALKDVIVGFKEADYMDALMCDANDCLDSIHDTPVYSVLNLTRVLAYCSDRLVLSKQEALDWASHRKFPSDYVQTLKKASVSYAGGEIYFSANELDAFREFAHRKLQAI
ncbi:DUF4111 domain-containing protein [Exiguobacterium sp. SH5S13]|uniref:aminoglycoside adenylyltransferase domain-containing protein n=1 Tax=unclassified Exiguobacterium TaxID=2644629 RepID=UPI00103E5D3B|nr:MULTISPECIES: aminoglycoside adenylyltransferase domain-containing protein [unclassified Exiguobacterium]TCI26407.1 DUF4111 domain-containing protein [Exiguobacterium sp. SH5S4]TCI50927.1 DUF4111 domain-containing protein [Exiguobacterium sp. SH5S13]